MWLCVEELRKILRSRLSVIVLIAIILMQIVTALSSYNEIENKCGSIKAYNEYADQYNGTLDRSLVDSSDVNKMISDSYRRTENTKEAFFYEQYLAAIVRANDYEAENSKAEPPAFQNVVGINILVQNLTSVVSTIFALVGLLFALYPIFFRDIENGMENIIYCSYIGRKDIVKAKIGAGLLFGIGWISVYYFLISIFTIILFGNVKVLNVPINCVACLSDCNYNISVLQYLLLGYLLLLIASLFMVACVMLIYSRVKKISIGILVGMALIILPMCIPKNGNIGKMFCLLPSAFGSALLIVGKNLELALLGTKIALPIVGMIVVTFLTIVLFMIIKWTFWKGRVET